MLFFLIAFATGNGHIARCFLLQDDLIEEESSSGSTNSGDEEEDEEEEEVTNSFDPDNLSPTHFQDQFGAGLQLDTQEYQYDPLTLAPIYTVESPSLNRNNSANLPPLVGQRRKKSMPKTVETSSKSTKSAARKSSSRKATKKKSKKATSQVDQENIRPESDRNKFQQQHQSRQQLRLSARRQLPTQQNLSPNTQEMTTRIKNQIDSMKKALTIAKKSIKDLEADKEDLEGQLQAKDDTISNLNQQNRDLFHQVAEGKKRSKSTSATQPLLLKKEDPIMEEIKQVTQKELWRHCKFVQSDKQKRAVTKFVMAKMGLLNSMTDQDQENWIHTYKDVPNAALNAKRSYAQSEMKKKAFEWIKAKKDAGVDVDDRLPTVEMILKCALRQVETDEEKEVFEWYWEDLLAAVVGVADWGPNTRHYTTITQAQVRIEDLHKTKSSDPETLITRSHEAFVVVLYDNCYGKWMAMHKYLEENPGKKVADNPNAKTEYEGKYTDSKSGQKVFSGWKPDGLAKFNAVQAQIAQSRNSDSPDGKENILQVERDCLASLREKRGLQAPDAETERKNKRRKKKNADAELLLPVEEVETFTLPGMEDDDEEG